MGSRRRAAAAREHGLRCSPAAELSAVHRPDADVHILGYELRLDRGLLDALEGFRADRARRIEAMAGRLRELGLDVDDRELRARREQGLPLGRPHLASAVLSDANAARLGELGVHDRDSLFAALLVPGAPAYVPRTRPTTADAIAAIHAAGGVAVWAHPYWDEDDPLPVLERFVAEGIDGVECFYATHTEEQVRTLHAGLSERRSPDHRLGRLPRARERALRALPRLLALRTVARPRADRRVTADAARHHLPHGRRSPDGRHRHARRRARRGGGRGAARDPRRRPGR